MPLDQLMRKLTARESPRQGREGSQLTIATINCQATAMDCDFCRLPAVTAEIMPMQDDRHSPCSPSSTASTSEQTLERLPTAPVGRLASAPMESSATSNLRVELLPSPLAAVSSQLAAARAVRARGKAALRSSTLEFYEAVPSLTLGEPLTPPGPLQQQTSSEHVDQLDNGVSRSSSVEAQLSSTYGKSRSPSGFSYQRATVVPQPSWAAALTSTTNMEPGSTNALAALSNGPPAPGTVLAAPATAEAAEFDSPLHSSLVSTSSVEAEAGDDAFWCEDCELECEWEDGVVAGWLRHQEHNGLLDILHTEEELNSVRGDHGTPITSRISLQAVYSSSLYA